MQNLIVAFFFFSIVEKSSNSLKREEQSKSLKQANKHKKTSGQTSTKKPVQNHLNNKLKPAQQLNPTQKHRNNRNTTQIRTQREIIPSSPSLYTSFFCGSWVCSFPDQKHPILL